MKLRLVPKTPLALRKYICGLCALMFVLVVSPADGADPFRPEDAGSSPKIRYIVDGQNWEPPSEIQSKINSSLPADLPQVIIQELFERSSLQNIEVREIPYPEGDELVVTARRLPKVGEIAFRGMSSLLIQQIRGSLRTKVGYPFIEEEAERDRDMIIVRLRERGYLSATTNEVERATNAGGELRITYPVTLNTPCRIAEVKTEPDAGLFDYFTTPIEVGSLCDRAAIEEILERQRARLLGEGYLSSELNLLGIDVAPDQQRASVRLRYSRGNKTRLEIVNRQSGVVSDVLSEFNEKISAYDILSLSDEELRSEVRRIFVNRGFANAAVNGPTRVTEANGDAVVRFYVQTGPLVVIGDVQFDGELPLSRDEVIDKLELSPGVFEGAVPFVEEDLAKYRDRLANVYLEEGYADVRVSDPVATYFPDGRSVTLLFVAKPGLRSVLRDVTILGRPFDFSLTTNFHGRILQPGQPVNAQKLKTLEEEIRLELMQAGYAYAIAQVYTKNLPPTGEVRPIQVTVDLNPGPLVKIGKIYAEGDSFGKRERIIDVSGLKTGDLFTPDALEQSRLRILKHDLFDTVSIEPFSSDSVERKDSVLDVVIRLTAKKSYSLGLSPGYGTLSGYRFNVDFAKNNLTRHGLRLTSTVTLSQEKIQNAVQSDKRVMGRKFTVGLMEPLLRIGDTVLPVDWSLVSGLEVSAQSLSDRYFETFDTGFSWRPLFFGRSWNFQFKLLHEWSKAIGQDVKPLEALERPTVTIREIEPGVSIDSRDNLEWPTRGFTLDAASKHARLLLSDVQYDRFSIDSSVFFPVYGRLSGALNLGGLKISDVVNARAEAVTAPGSRRATLAGRALVRGFPEASSTATPGPLLWLNFVSPSVNPSLVCLPTLKPIGASNVLYAKSELRLRTPWLGESLGFVGFVDSGAAFFTASELGLLQQKLTSSGDVLDSGGIDQCALKSAKVISDAPVGGLTSELFRSYRKSSYVSTGVGLRYIIQNFASVNIDVGFPVREPEPMGIGECVAPSDVPGSAEAPVCVKRSSTSRLFGLFPVRGAFHLGIGANF